MADTSDMSDMMETLRRVLGDNADEKINGVLGMLSQNSNGGETDVKDAPETAETGISPETLLKMRKIINSVSAGDDERSRLLLSLKPYMRGTRKKTIDSAIKLLSAAQLGRLLDLGL